MRCQTISFRSVTRCDADTRYNLYPNVVLSGGTNISFRMCIRDIRCSVSYAERDRSNPFARLSLTWCRRSRGATPLRVTVPSIKRIAAKDFYAEINLYQLFGVGALAHRGLPPVRGLVRAKPLAYPALHLSAREGVQVTATPCLWDRFRADW